MGLRQGERGDCEVDTQHPEVFVLTSDVVVEFRLQHTEDLASSNAVVVAVVLNSRPYAVLFSDVSQEEATEIIAKLQDSEVDYQYKSGDILVKEDVLDKTRAELVYAGYPTSGFTYNVFTDNAGLMTTDSDKRTYKLYELQNRIGATVELFKGVKDAKVTIALGEDNQYALSEIGKQQP